MRKFIVICLSGLMLGFSACESTGSKKQGSTGVKTKTYKYVCTMHPEIGSDKPGVCSKCGMDLVERDTTDK